MPLDSRDEFDGHEAYPLNLPRPKTEDGIFRYYHSKLEEISPSLFIAESNECRVDAISTASTDPTINETRNKAYRAHAFTNHVANPVSSLPQLKDILKVIQIFFDVYS